MVYESEYLNSISTAQAAVSATEKRLYALPILKERIEDNREVLVELESLGVEAARQHCSSLVRLIHPGMRISPEEAHAAQLAELRSRLAADEREVRKMQNALNAVKEDPYFSTIALKYFDGVKDTQAAEELHCDPATVRRNRNRLVRRIALRLYGVDCL